MVWNIQSETRAVVKPKTVLLNSLIALFFKKFISVSSKYDY